MVTGLVSICLCLCVLCWRQKLLHKDRSYHYAFVFSQSFLGPVFGYSVLHCIFLSGKSFAVYSQLKNHREDHQYLRQILLKNLTYNLCALKYLPSFSLPCFLLIRCHLCDCPEIGLCHMIWEFHCIVTCQHINGKKVQKGSCCPILEKGF